MKRLLLAAGLLTGACCVGLQAQIPDARANVPFDFWVGQKLLPAGDYTISHTASGAIIISELERKARSTATFLAGTVSRPESQGAGLLEFNRYGNTYFLQKIWKPSQMEGLTVPRGSREKELMSRSVPNKTNVALLDK